MSEAARVESIDALKHFRIALFKFIESANASLNNGESELRQMQNWLENEQYSHWKGQIHKRHTQVERCKEAIRMKRIFKDAAGRTPNAIDEEKALRIAMVQMEEAEAKFANTKKYSRVLTKEIEVYKGAAQRFATTVQVDLPSAVAMLDQMLASLEAYVSLNAADLQQALPSSTSSAPVELPPELKPEGG